MLKDNCWVIAALLAVAVSFWPASVNADYEDSRRWFYSMPADERGLLQSSLILIGQYNAFVDGEFGPATYRALTGFQSIRGERQTGVLTSVARNDLDDRAAYLFSELGMEVVNDARGSFSLVVPKTLLSESEPTRRGTAYFDPYGVTRLETINKPYTDESYQSLYATLTTESSVRRVTYKTFNSERFVVSGTREGFPFYIFMFSAPSASIGFSIEWDAEFDLVGGMLATFIASHSYPVHTTLQTPLAETTPSASLPTTPRLGYGTGFFVAENGILVTNHHVVESCSVLNIPGYGTARMVTGDPELDLAVLRLTENQAHGIATIRSDDAELGEDVVLVGFPLASVLNSSLTVGTGIVSSETGLGGEQRWFTTNVGIQPGNSGGPILDEYGQIIGVAVAKIDERTLLSATGTVAPNVGFAIKNGPLLDYLSIFRLPESKPTKTPLAVRAVVDLAKQFTVQVICLNN